MLLTVTGLVFLEAMALLGAPRLAADFLAEERRHQAFEMLVLTSYPRSRLILGALAGRLRGYVLALAVALPGILYIGLRWPEAAGWCGACVRGRTGGLGILWGLLGWAEAVGFLTLGAGVGARFAVHFSSGFLSATLAQLVSLGAWVMSRGCSAMLIAVAAGGVKSASARDSVIGPFILIVSILVSFGVGFHLLRRLEGQVEVE